MEALEEKCWWRKDYERANYIINNRIDMSRLKNYQKHGCDKCDGLDKTCEDRRTDSYKNKDAIE